MSDLISRAEAIEAMRKDIEFEKEHAIPYEDYDSGCIGGLKKAIRTLEALSSADAEPIVIRSKTLLPTKDFKEWAKRIKEENPNAIVIPCDAEVVSAVPQLKQTDTLIIADALRYLAKDTERHLVDRTRADALRQQFLKYGASMCKGGDDK